MTLHIFPVLINVIACALIILRLITFTRNRRRHKPTMSTLAWLLAVSCCMVIVSL
ncbi:phage holin family protein [Salmonella enterica]|nr:phage holin family protein [Salmonella enterica]EHG9741742.1 phage holin family protein [Salmonella enterica]